MVRSGKHFYKISNFGVLLKLSRRSIGVDNKVIYDKHTLKSDETTTEKESVQKSCESTLKHNLTLCHVNSEELSAEKKVAKVKKWTKKLREHTSLNGLFVTVWTGTPLQKAFVGIALNKASPS